MTAGQIGVWLIGSTITSLGIGTLTENVGFMALTFGILLLLFVVIDIMKKA